MIVRDAKSVDIPAIQRIHAEMGLDYQFPDLDSPLCAVQKVAVVDGEVVGACVLRLTAETYLWVKGSDTAKARAIAKMQPKVLHAAWLLGIDEIEARIPEAIESRFQRALRRLGWTRNRPGWFAWTRKTL